METRSLKALSVAKLQGNRQGNQKETLSFHKETCKETATGNGGAPALPASLDLQPKPKAWLTAGGELRTSGHVDDLAGEIVKLTADNLAEQKRLLLLHCEAYDKNHIWRLWELWEERAAIMEHDGGLSREEAEQQAAEQYHLLAFLPELQAQAV